MFGKKKLKIDQGTLLEILLACECLPEGTPLFLDKDGDVCYPADDESAEDAKARFHQIGVAKPGTFKLSSAKLYRQGATWRVEGYGNEFDNKQHAMEFIANFVGVDVADLEEVGRHVTNFMISAGYTIKITA